MVWARRFILVDGKRRPRDMGEAEVEGLLSGLAVQGSIVKTGGSAGSVVGASCRGLEAARSGLLLRPREVPFRGEVGAGSARGA